MQFPRPPALLAALLLISAGQASPALAQTGVSDDRVSLPDGPGSRDGMGDDASVNLNMGVMSYSIPLELPEGYADITPSLALTYSSGAGSSVLGMGWSIPEPAIERLTVRGVPQYTPDDEFTADGQDLVQVASDAGSATYRERFEKSFTRYTWVSPGDGKEGYWKAEMPNGQVSYYGATHEGVLVPEARVGTEAGTFRYHLVDTVDVYGHRIRHDYVKTTGGSSLITRTGWVHQANGDPRFTVTFEYQSRPDAISDCKPGFNLLLQERLTTVTVRSAGQVQRRYQLTYESEALSGGATRLARVEQFSPAGARHPLVQTFGYSRALGGVCNGTMCDLPIIKNMGNIGVSLASGAATLVDINGDALPDIVETPTSGMHRFFLSRLAMDGSHTLAPAVNSSVGDASTRVAQPSVQMLDVNGDGFADMVNTKTGEVLYNSGNGDWSNMAPVGTNALPDLDADAADGQISIRFMDYDNDKRIDLIRSTQTVTQVFRNTGTDFVEDTSAQPIGAGFAEDNLQLKDMNGDGLLDGVRLQTGQLSYRLNHGRGRWAPAWTDITGLPIESGEIPFAELEDINGDGLADLVVVVGNEVKFAINRNGDTFDAPQSITTAQGGSIPTRDGSTSVLMADMNGNGSSDVVWVDGAGQVTYLEIFPVRPNLLSRIENGLGRVTEVTYASAVEHMARDGGSTAWVRRMPQSHIVVDSVDEYDLFSNIHQVSHNRYHDGYYDGVEKRFRGFERVDVDSPEDDGQEPGWSLHAFDVGVQDRYRAGLPLSVQYSSAGRDIREIQYEYEDCPLTDVPTTGLRFPIRHVCLVRETTIHKEGAPQAEWITTERRRTYDGYGNITLNSDLGVVAVGGQGCAACTGGADEFGEPCGQQCLGDELYTEKEFVEPSGTGGRWMLNKPTWERTYGRPLSDLYTETNYYYDGQPFVGLPSGQLTHGNVCRSTERINTQGMVADVTRQAHDAHGNSVATIEPTGTVEDPASHRRLYTYDADGLHLERVDTLLRDANGDPYRLRRDVTYDPLWNKPLSATSWVLVRNDQAQSPQNLLLYTYDEFGRLSSLVRPGGDTLQSPSEVYEYAMGSPVSQIVIRRRSTAGGPLDIELRRCVDGFARTVQERLHLGDGSYQVSGFKLFNKKGVVRQAFQPYVSTESACDLVAPEGTRSTVTTFDALERMLTTVHEDGVSLERMAYGPLSSTYHDEEDTNAASPHANTPTTRKLNGLNTPTRIIRQLGGASAPVVYQLKYDGLGRLGSYQDPGSATQTQEYDLLGRMVRSTNPDRGTQLATYDVAGNLIEFTDGRGKRRALAYDGAHRVTSEWDPEDRENTLITYTYDQPGDCPASRCTNVAGSLATIRYPLGDGRVGEWRQGFHARGQQIYAARIHDGMEFEFRTTYDNAARVVALQYPDGTTLNHTLDPAGRLTAIPGYLDSVTYDARGDLEELHYANGVTTAYAHDARGRLSAVNTARAGQAIDALSYVRDRKANVTSIMDGAVEAGRPGRAAELGYDAFYQLTRAQLSTGQSAFEDTLTYAYAPSGNITSATSSKGSQSAAHVGTYSYGSAPGSHAVTQAGAIAFEYDSAGNVVTRGEHALEWDWKGRLTRVTRGDRDVARYFYGNNTTRLEKREGGSVTLYPSHDFAIRDGVATVEIELQGHRLAKQESLALATTVLSDVAPVQLSGSDATPVPDDEINAADAWIAVAAEAGELALPSGQRVSDASALLAASARRMLLGSETSTTYFHLDHQGSTVSATDSSGAVVQRVAYHPFGALRFVEGGALEDARFTGKERDSGSGLTYFGDRYLDPVVGRWLSVDPAFMQVDEQSFTRPTEATGAYNFVSNNPLNVVDPDGQTGKGCASLVKTFARAASRPVPPRASLLRTMSVARLATLRSNALTRNSTLARAQSFAQVPKRGMATKVVRTMTAKEMDDSIRLRNPKHQNAFKEGTMVSVEQVIDNNETEVRFHLEGSQDGRWSTPLGNRDRSASEAMALLALPSKPTHKSTVNFAVGTILHRGIAGPAFGQSGGGQQTLRGDGPTPNYSPPEPL